MANLPRYALIEDGSTFHVTWQCHNKSWLLKDDWAKRIYYSLLLQYKDRYRIQIYSYCFMSNHPHLTGSCEDKNLFSDFFRLVNSRFACLYNKRKKRRGQVVMDRFKSPNIQTHTDLLKVMSYIDLNPKRAGMIDHPQEYFWSSYAYYAQGREDPLLTPAPTYLELGLNSQDRQRAYQSLVEEILKTEDWKEKKDYSRVAYIGNPDWVKTKSAQLKRQQGLRMKIWRMKYEMKFNSPQEPVLSG